MEANIYITIDSRSPKSSVKHYGYVMECIVEGKPRTREGFGRTMGTYHHATLTALVDALARFIRPCEIMIYAADEFILSMLDLNLEIWAKNGFITSKGNPVSNQCEWEEIWRCRDCGGHHYSTCPGRHQYERWIKEELERRKKEEKDV